MFEAYEAGIATDISIVSKTDDPYMDKDDIDTATTKASERITNFIFNK